VGGRLISTMTLSWAIAGGVGVAGMGVGVDGNGVGVRSGVGVGSTGVGWALIVPQPLTISALRMSTNPNVSSLPFISCVLFLLFLLLMNSQSFTASIPKAKTPSTQTTALAACSILAGEGAALAGMAS